MSPLQTAILRGGRKPRIVSIKRGKLIHQGVYEANGIFDVKVTLMGKKGRTRTIAMVEKEFKPKTSKNVLAPNIKDPKMQFKTMQELLRLNREMKLGLPILPTVRLKKIKGQKTTLLVTKVKNEIKLSELKADEIKELNEQEEQIRNILREHGYSTHSDFFIVARNPVTGKLIPWVADFGNLRKFNLRK